MEDEKTIRENERISPFKVQHVGNILLLMNSIVAIDWYVIISKYFVTVLVLLRKDYSM